MVRLYMQSNYFSIERTIYRQLDARVLLLQVNDDFQRKEAARILRSGFMGPDWYCACSEKLVITTQHMDLGQVTTLLYVWKQA